MVEPAPFGRVVAELRGAEPGPLVLVVGGIHGNEPLGLMAARRVLAKLDNSTLRGDVTVLAGNLRALAQNRRFLVRDLNRQWTAAKVAAAARAPAEDPEALEQKELGAALEAALAAARGPVYYLELHTTSAE